MQQSEKQMLNVAHRILRNDYYNNLALMLNAKNRSFKKKTIVKKRNELKSNKC